MARFVKVCSMCIPWIFREGTTGMESVERMKSYWNSRLDEIAIEKPDLIVLPEVCDRFNEMSVPEVLEYYEVRGNLILDFFRKKAAELNSYIAYSAVLKAEDGFYRNSTVMIARDGTVMGRYDKNYPMTGEIDDYGMIPGTETPVFKCDFGTVGCMICFDLNFDKLRLRYAALKPELLLFSSRYHGGMKQQLWAYSCQSHLIGAIGGPNRPGVIMAPNGRVLAETTEYTQSLVYNLNLDCRHVHLDFNFEKLEALKRKYGSAVEIDDIGHLGAVLVRNHLEDRTIDELLSEFEIERLDDYLSRAEAYRNNFLKITNKEKSL